MRVLCVALMAFTLAGCASIAPVDLREEATETAFQFGRVTKVEKKTYVARSDAGRGAVTAVIGVVGEAMAGAMADAISGDTQYIHQIDTPSGEQLTEMSRYEFPVGTCVSIGANKTSYRSLLARSTRCRS